MSHTSYKINCKKCEKSYCLICEGECLKCGVTNVLDKKTMKEIEGMRKHMSGAIR